MQVIDTYQFQKERIIRIVEELAPGNRVEFDDDAIFIKFRVLDPFMNVYLTEVSGEWIPSELADRSDDWLRQYITNLARM